VRWPATSAGRFPCTGEMIGHGLNSSNMLDLCFKNNLLLANLVMFKTELTGNSAATALADASCHSHCPHTPGCAMSEEGVPVSEMIDGINPSSWRLPLAPLSSTSLPEPYSLGAQSLNGAGDCNCVHCPALCTTGMYASYMRLVLQTAAGETGVHPFKMQLTLLTASSMAPGCKCLRSSGTCACDSLLLSLPGNAMTCMQGSPNPPFPSSQIHTHLC
jgi:hypothetical protein